MAISLVRVVVGRDGVKPPPLKFSELSLFGPSHNLHHE